MVRKDVSSQEWTKLKKTFTRLTAYKLCLLLRLNVTILKHLLRQVSESTGQSQTTTSYFGCTFGYQKNPCTQISVPSLDDVMSQSELTTQSLKNCILSLPFNRSTEQLKDNRS